MKKSIIIISTILTILIVVVAVNAIGWNKKAGQVATFNEQFTRYQGQKIYGVDVATILNKAIDNNTKFNISMDEEGNYVLDDENSIQVEIQIQTNNTIYTMETIQKVGINKFVSNFNLTLFKCSNIEYHTKSKKVSKIVIEQIEE